MPPPFPHDLDQFRPGNGRQVNDRQELGPLARVAGVPQPCEAIVNGTYASKIYSRDVDGRTLSAIQTTTAGAMGAVPDLPSAGVLPLRGFIRQEDISLKVFRENRFGRICGQPGSENSPLT